MNARIRASLLLLGLFLLAWIPRTAALDAYVSPDERKWLARSANFTYALSQADYARTFQREHPGVTVMWAHPCSSAAAHLVHPGVGPCSSQSAIGIRIVCGRRSGSSASGAGAASILAS